MKNLHQNYISTTLDFNSRIGRKLLTHDSTKVVFVEQKDDCIVIEEGNHFSFTYEVSLQDIETYLLEWECDKIDSHHTASDDAFAEFLDLMPSNQLAKVSQMANYYKRYKKAYFDNVNAIQANNRELNHIPHQAPQWLMCVGDPRE